MGNAENENHLRRSHRKEMQVQNGIDLPGGKKEKISPIFIIKECDTAIHFCNNSREININWVK